MRPDGRMPELTCRRLQDHRQECRHICYGDVYVGTISANAEAAET